MYAWGKKRKMLVFTGVYVCVKAKLTFVSFFFNFFFLHLSLSHSYCKLIKLRKCSNQYSLRLLASHPSQMGVS